ncbi:hypothetical protein AB0M44_35795 [Streptosporangium subroseum]|uniref:hypothetical protein n=1 Tax=Streptosporangium subroseum TaxID=106412 RepID=UPI0034307336
MKEVPNIRRLPRRSVLTGTLALGLSAVAAESVFSPTPAAAEPQYTSFGWRFCNRCFSLFKDDQIGWSTCPLNGWHRAQGWIFKLTYNRESGGIGATSRIQANWRHCYKCSALYWYMEPGACPQGNGNYDHSYKGRAPQQFLLPHGIGQPRGRQNKWRFCVKCSGLFYNGYANKGEYGICPRDPRYGHRAAGYDFAIFVQDYN